MTSSQPVQPQPYIAVGDGWTVTVRVPGHGVWRRDPMQVSQTYAVYNQDGRDFHVTIDSAFIANSARPAPQAALNTHITSNTPIGGRVLHWPNPGVLSVPQLAWMNQHNSAGQFNALIAAFDARIRLCATNVRLSRDYDQAMNGYRTYRLQVAAGKRANKADFLEDLTDWVDACPFETYLEAFKEKDDWYALDPDRGIIVRLDPRPLSVKQGDGLNPGFAKLCEMITGTAAALTDTQWNDLSTRLTLLRIGKTGYAMHKNQFDACQQAAELLTLDQVVEESVRKWAQATASSTAHTKVAADQTLMNVTGPDSNRYCLKTLNLLDKGELTQIGMNAAAERAAKLQCLTDAPWAYPMSRMSDLLATLPTAVRISRRAQPDVFILHEHLLDGWSTELEQANSTDPVPLARALVSKNAGCQVFAENLLVGEQVGMTIYLRRKDGSGPVLYVGPKDEALPAAQVSPDKPINLKGQVSHLSSYFSGGVSSSLVARKPDIAIVVCDSNGQTALPPIFVEESTLAVLDLTKAKEGFAAKMQELRDTAKAEAAKAEAAIAAETKSFSDAWMLITADINGDARAATLVLYKMPDGTFVAVLPDSPGAVEAEKVGATAVDWIEFARSDKKMGQATRRFIYFVCNNDARAWVDKFANHIRDTKPDLPKGFGGYMISPKQ